MGGYGGHGIFGYGSRGYGSHGYGSHGYGSHGYGSHGYRSHGYGNKPSLALDQSVSHLLTPHFARYLHKSYNPYLLRGHGYGYGPGGYGIQGYGNVYRGIVGAPNPYYGTANGGAIQSQVYSQAPAYSQAPTYIEAPPNSQAQGYRQPQQYQTKTQAYNQPQPYNEQYSSNQPQSYNQPSSYSITESYPATEGYDAPAKTNPYDTEAYAPEHTYEQSYSQHQTYESPSYESNKHETLQPYGMSYQPQVYNQGYETRYTPQSNEAQQAHVHSQESKPIQPAVSNA